MTLWSKVINVEVAARLLSINSFQFVCSRNVTHRKYTTVRRNSTLNMIGSIFISLVIFIYFSVGFFSSMRINSDEYFPLFSYKNLYRETSHNFIQLLEFHAIIITDDTTRVRWSIASTENSVKIFFLKRCIAIYFCYNLSWIYFHYEILTKLYIFIYYYELLLLAFFRQLYEETHKYFPSDR